MTDLEAKLLSALNLFCFQKIWNEPVSELRANIVPTMVQDRSVTGNVSLNGKVYSLPSNTDPYYVYVIPESLMYVFVTRQIPDEWISSTDLCNLHDILIHTYHLSGRMIHKGNAFFKRIGNKYLLAISKKMAQTCLSHVQMKEIRFTMYFDSDFTSKMTVGSYKTPYTDTSYLYRYQIYSFIQSCPHSMDHTKVFINGYEKQIQNIDSFPIDAYIDVIHDENDIFVHNLDLSVTENNIAFYSEKDSTHKQLIHIPKELNPDNKILTHNTCDIYIREKLSDGTLGRGLYLHRCAQRSVDQVTHNDLSIPMFIMDAYRDYLGTQDICLHLVFRQHDKDNYLIRDKNYIDLLYTCDDETIVRHLQGKVRADLSFWKASHLEKSTYVEMMFDVPNVLTTSNMWDYVDGLGYYHVMALLCKKIIHTDLLAWYNQTLAFNKPYLFMNNLVYPFVYRGDTKLHDSVVQYSNQDAHSLVIGVDELVGLDAGDKLTVEMFLDGSKNIYTITPVPGAAQIEVPYKDFVILEEIENELYPIKGFDISSAKSYRELTSYTGDIFVATTTTGTKLTFGPTTYNRKFIVQNRLRVYKWNAELDSVLEEGNPIYLNLHYPVRDAGYEVPIWHTPHCRVYLNGKYLIQGIDFAVQEFKTSIGDLVHKQICVHNLEYLKSENNTVEWFATSAVEENEVHGYMVDNRAAVPQELALLFEHMTMVHVDGLYVQDVQDKGNYIGIPTNPKYRQGAPFQACTVVPELINEFLTKYHPNDDVTRLEILNDYFYGKQPIIPPIVVLEKSHKCYSNYVTTVIRDILNGTLKGISFDPDDDRMRAQFSDYLYLKDKDLVFSGDYDLNYVDVFPHYKQITVPDTNVYQILQAFIRIIMPQDSVTSGEVYYDN